MPDSLRSLNELQALLADNSTGAISAQDVRDFLFSMKRPYGSIYMTSPVPVAVVTPGTYIKANGTTVLSDNTVPYLFDMPANNRLRYIGGPDIHVHIAGQVGISTAGTNDLLGVRLVKNGTTELIHSTSPRYVQTGSDVGSLPLHGDTHMSTNEYLEVWVTNEDAATDVTLSAMYLFAMAMFY